MYDKPPPNWWGFFVWVETRNGCERVDFVLEIRITLMGKSRQNPTRDDKVVFFGITKTNPDKNSDGLTGVYPLLQIVENFFCISGCM